MFLGNKHIYHYNKQSSFVTVPFVAVSIDTHSCTCHLVNSLALNFLILHVTLNWSGQISYLTYASGPSDF